MEWGDRVFLPMPGEEYEFPNVVKYLVREAAREGTWEPGKAVAAVARDMGEPAWDQIPRLVEILGKKAEGNHVTAIQIKQACNAVHLGERVDSLIADLKACGILSPSLGYLPEAARKRSPVYELNPCLSPGIKIDAAQRVCHSGENRSPEVAHSIQKTGFLLPQE